MGSLMAGWDSHSPDPKASTYERNRSFTQGEIDAYWKLKKITEEEHLKSISDLAENSQESTCTESEEKLERSNSLPLANTSENITSNSKADLAKLIKKNAWWTRSNWAFLNEPPVIIATEGTSSKYASQHYVLNTK